MAEESAPRPVPQMIVGRLCNTLAKHTGGVHSVDSDFAGNTLYTAGYDRKVYLWDTTTLDWEVKDEFGIPPPPDPEAEPLKHPPDSIDAPITGVVLHFYEVPIPPEDPEAEPTGEVEVVQTVIISTTAGQVQVWQKLPPPPPTPPPEPEVPEGEEPEEVPPPADPEAEEEEKQVILVWTCTRSVDVLGPSGVGTCINLLAKSEDSTHLMVGSADHYVRVYSLDTWECIAQLAHGEAVTAMMEHGGVLITGSLDKKIRVWDRATWECTHTLTHHTGAITGLRRFAGDSEGGEDGSRNRFLSCSADGSIGIWTVEDRGMPGILHDWVCQTTLKGHSTGIHSLAVLDQHQVISGGSDGKIIVWYWNRHSEKTTEWVAKKEHKDTNGSIRMLHAHNECLLACGADGSIRMYR